MISSSDSRLTSRFIASERLFTHIILDSSTTGVDSALDLFLRNDPKAEKAFKVHVNSWNTTEGIQVGIQALVAQNYGAEDKERVRESIKESFNLVAFVGILATLVLIVFRHKLFEIFTPGNLEAIELGSNYLLILGLSQAFMSIEIGLAGCFNGMSDTKTPAVLGVVNNLLRVPISLVLMPLVGVYGVWIAMSSTSILKGVAAMGLLYKKVKKYMAG